MILSANDFFRTVPRAGLSGALFSFSPDSSPGALFAGGLFFFAFLSAVLLLFLPAPALSQTRVFLFLCKMTKPLAEPYKKP